MGLVMAFGSGVLISAVAYELVEDAFGTAGGSGAVGFGLFAGALAFYLGDLAIARFGGEERKSAAGGQDAGSDMAILLGTVPDCIPESIVLGVSLLGGGGVSVAMLPASSASITHPGARGRSQHLPPRRVAPRRP
jgi:zinc transporter, ZIP family